jgi:nucleoside-diphosphate-sugar epimerase
VKKRLPRAEIAFKPYVELRRLIDSTLHPVDDHVAQKEWGWNAHYDLERMIDDFLAEMEANPQRYA